MSHGDSITRAPPGFVGHRDARRAYRSPRSRIASAAIYGVQFHPEVVHTERGQEVLKAFLYDAAGCRPTWTNVSIIEHAVAEIRAQVGTERVICGLSGGVDSAVAAALVHKAIGDQLTCVFVDTGLLRLDEAEQVERTFREQFDDRPRAREGRRPVPRRARRRHRSRSASARRSASCSSACSRKRRAISDDARFLVQGTLYPGHRRVGRRRQREHQVAPQRRRAARRHGLRARRAAAQPVQGRGARGRRRARPARGDRVAPALPRARASRSASSARSPASASRSCRPPTRSSPRRSSAPGSTARSGRASPCSRR